MEKYRRLTPIDRYQIEVLKQSGYSARAIAMKLGRASTSISREFRRNTVDEEYSAKRAQKLAFIRRKTVGPPSRIDTKFGKKISFLLLKMQFSPEQIRAHFSRLKIVVSSETIYKFIYFDRRIGGELYLNLRRRRRYRRPHKSVHNLKNTGKRVNQNWIAERPKIVEARSRVGDFERDTVLGKKGSGILLTIVDRKTRYTRILKIKGVNAEAAHRATVRMLKFSIVHTITNDNGAEFAFHKKTAQALKTKIFFNDPYCSWQRGTNENTNGLIRQYYPKGHDFSQVTNKDIRQIQHKLNNRPRKCLGFKTPSEVERSLSRVVH